MLAQLISKVAGHYDADQVHNAEPPVFRVIGLDDGQPFDAVPWHDGGHALLHHHDSRQNTRHCDD